MIKTLRRFIRLKLVLTAHWVVGLVFCTLGFGSVDSLSPATSLLDEGDLPRGRRKTQFICNLALLNTGIPPEPRWRTREIVYEYFGLNGSPISDGRLIRRIGGLNIPETWEGVWIATNSRDNIQAAGVEIATGEVNILHRNGKLEEYPSFDLFEVPGINRRVKFNYYDADGQLETRSRVRSRLKNLPIPENWYAVKYNRDQTSNVAAYGRLNKQTAYLIFRKSDGSFYRRRVKPGERSPEALITGYFTRKRVLRYWNINGIQITDPKVIETYKTVTERWRSVILVPTPDAYLIAKGVDDSGKVQHRYHTRFMAASSRFKYSSLMIFAQNVGYLRVKAGEDLDELLRGRKLTKEGVLGGLVLLLDSLPLRPGNKNSAEKNGNESTYGLTTLLKSAFKHINPRTGEIQMEFVGKDGQGQSFTIFNRPVARLLARLKNYKKGSPSIRDYMAKYETNDIAIHVTTAMLNTYIREQTGLTSKFYRTWKATVLAVSMLMQMDYEEKPRGRSRQWRQVTEVIADQWLGNTPGITGSMYIHEWVREALMEGFDFADLNSRPRGRRPHKLNREEADTLRFLQTWLTHIEDD